MGAAVPPSLLLLVHCPISLVAFLADGLSLSCPLWQVLAELKEYATEVDVDFVRKAVRAIGRCAIKVEVRAGWLWGPSGSCGSARCCSPARIGRAGGHSTTGVSAGPTS